METGGVLALAVTVAVLVAVTWLVARGPETLACLFHAEPLGWPRGVQEEDDVRWRWPARWEGPSGRDGRRPPPGDAYRVGPQPLGARLTLR